MADPNKLDPKMVGQSILLDRLYPSSLPPEDMDRQAFLDEQNDRARQTFQTLSKQEDNRRALREKIGRGLPGAFASGAEVLKAAAGGWYTGQLEQAEQRQTAAQRGHTQDPLADVNLRMWQAAPMAAEVAASIASPVAGAAIDAKDFTTAVAGGSLAGAALAGIGLVPGVGDVAEQSVKGMKKLVGEINEARRRLTSRADTKVGKESRLGVEEIKEVEEIEEIDPRDAWDAWTDGTTDAARQWQEKGVESPYFRRWFGDSKIVNESGEPRVLYHGSKTEFDAFDLEKAGTAHDAGWLGEGFYFTTKPESAGEYSRLKKSPTHFTGTGEFGSILPVYVSIKNPYIWGRKDLGSRSFVQTGARLPEDIHDAVVAKVGFEADYTPRSDRWVPDPTRPGESIWNPEMVQKEQQVARAMREVLQERGYDGIIADIIDGHEIIAFHPTQIKSATGNVGTFDPKDPRFAYGAIPGAAVVRSQQSEEAE
jgi:hypothetical protein